MSTTTDRGAVQLALECATKLQCDMLRSGIIDWTPDSVAIKPLGELLANAAAILAWHDARVAERSSRDELKRKAPIPIDMGSL